MSTLTDIEKFDGWLNLEESTNMWDNQFSVLKNMFYDKDKRIQTRRGITTFWNSIGSDPITSYFYFKNDITWAWMALCTAWTVMYKYNTWTSDWDSIKTWLTEFETDWTTRTRWSFAVYLNIVYMCNWKDAYADYDWTTYTEHWAQPKCRYLIYMADSIYWAWADAAPSTIYATTAWAANAETLNANDLVVGWDEMGRINWMKDLGNIQLVFKNKKIYSVAWDLASSQAIDGQNWGYWHRAIQNVENALMYYSDAWVDTVKARGWISWASAMATEPKSNDLRKLLDKITASQYNNNAWAYIAPLNNYYFSFDTWDDSVPDTTLVYSSLVWAWSQYVQPPVYDYGHFIDSDWNFQYLAASATWWQMFQIETWFTDFWVWIDCELKTKEFDFGSIATWKTFDAVTIEGLKNEGSDITVEIIVGWDIVSTSTITDDYANITSWLVTISSDPLSTSSISWWVGTCEDIDLFSYLIRIPMYDSDSTIQVRMYSSDNPNIWTLEKIQISREDQTFDVFPTANIW